MVAIEPSTFVDLRDRTKAFFEQQLKDSKTVNGVSVSSHLQAAIKMDMANGMTEEQAHEKWKVKRESIVDTPDNDVIYIYRLYQNLMDCRTYGINGINPLNLHDIECYERRYGRIDEPTLKILKELDEIYYKLKD